jgi:hypothetical protein
MNKMDEMLEGIEAMELQALRDQWEELSGDGAPRAMSKELLRLAVAYRIQEQEFGGLSRRTSLRLRALSNGGSGSVASVPSSQLKPGTKLLREWNGKIHEVSALEDGRYAYAGRVWKSLSEIAREITGVRWSGPRFFGTRNRRRTAPHG